MTMLFYIVLALLPLSVLSKLALVGSAWEIFPDHEDYINDDQDLSSTNFGNLGDSLLETHLISSRGYMRPNRKARSPTYHIMESPGLKSHFQFELPVDDDDTDDTAEKLLKQGTIKKLNKRSLESMDSGEDTKNSELIDTSIENTDQEHNFKHEKYTNFEESKTESDENVPVSQTPREARGATKEQWIKQPYPVDFGSQKDSSSNNINNDDQHTSETNNNNINVRAPRVHFVTQKRLDQAESRQESSPRLSPPVRSYDTRKELPRARSLEPYEYRGDSRRRSYDTPRRDYNNRDVNYGRSRDFDRYNSRGASTYAKGDEFDIYGRGPSQKKQRRIIYYANLPDMSRTSPNVDLRGRYRYPDSEPNEYYRNDRRYDDGYVTSPTVAVSDTDPYLKDRRVDLPPTYIPNYYRRYPATYGQLQAGRRRLDPAGTSTERISERMRDRAPMLDRKETFPLKRSPPIANEGRSLMDRDIYLDRPRNYAFTQPTRIDEMANNRFYRRP